MSSAIVGPVQDVPGARLVNASQPAAVLVVLRNGQVLKVIDPGKRVGKYFRGPMIGNFQVIEVNTGWVKIERRITNVRSASDEGVEYHADALTATVQAKLNPGNEFQDLKRLISDAGLGLADALVAALTRGLELALRATFAMGTHAFWYGASLTQEFSAMFPAGQSFGPPGYGQLLTLVSLDEVKVEWDPHFLTKRGADMKVAISGALEAEAVAAARVVSAQALAAAQGRAAVEALEVKARIELEQRIQSFAALAGRPAEYFTNPQAYAELTRQRHELAMKLMEPHNAGLLHSRPELLSLFAGYLGQAPGVMPPAVMPPEAPVQQEPRQLTSGPAGSTDRPSSSAAGLVLSVNAKARRKWRDYRPADDIVGIAAAARRNSAAVVAVINGVIPAASDISALEQAFAEYLNLGRVTVACAVATDRLSSLIADFVTMVAPGAADEVDINAQTMRDSAGEYLVITLASRSGAAARLRDQLSAPEPPILAAIEALLSFDKTLIQVNFS
jgi:hypothetical protein